VVSFGHFLFIAWPNMDWCEEWNSLITAGERDDPNDGSSRHDPDERMARKAATSWVGK
jgi:hypothetical protein